MTGAYQGTYKELQLLDEGSLLSAVCWWFARRVNHLDLVSALQRTRAASSLGREQVTWGANQILSFQSQYLVFWVKTHQAAPTWLSASLPLSFLINLTAWLFYQLNCMPNSSLFLASPLPDIIVKLSKCMFQTEHKLHLSSWLVLEKTLLSSLSGLPCGTVNAIKNAMRAYLGYRLEQFAELLHWQEGYLPNYMQNHDKPFREAHQLLRDRKVE